MQAAQPRRPDSTQPLPKAPYRPFCLSVKGHVKILRLAPEPYIVITGFEVTVVFFFIILYLLRLDRLLTWLFWPLLDIINSLVTTVFMIIVSVLALIPETTTMTVLGGVFGLVSVVCCIADGALIYRKLLFNPSGPYQKKPSHEQKHIL
nr:chemokine-like factor isoform X1 [Loxodonta africana]